MSRTSTIASNVWQQWLLVDFARVPSPAFIGNEVTYLTETIVNNRETAYAMAVLLHLHTYILSWEACQLPST